MKKLFALILVLVLCACLCSCSDKGYAVHVKAPESWDSVHLWAWSTEKSKDAFDEWPGATMTADEEGWYTATVPEWVDAAVVSGNGGSVQTEDIKYFHKEVWITVYEDLSYWREFEKPAYTTATVVVPADWGTPNCWAWSSTDKKDVFTAWPGSPMTKTGESYTIDLPSWVDHVIISNNDGTVQTVDLAVEPGKNFWAAVWETGNAEVVYSEADLDTALKYSAGALYARLDTVDKGKIHGDKSLTCIFYVENNEEQSRKPVLDFLPGEENPITPEEIRYMVNYTYGASRAVFYYGPLTVYDTFITVEIVDLRTDKVIAREYFQSEPLPESVHSQSSKYYAPYPDEKPIKQWTADVLNGVR